MKFVGCKDCSLKWLSASVKFLSLHPNLVDWHLLASGACEWIGTDSIFRWVPSILQLVCVFAKIENCPQALHLRQDFFLLQYQPESSTQKLLAESCKHFAHRPCFEFSRQEAPNSGSGRMKYDDFEVMMMMMMMVMMMMMMIGD